MRNLLTLIIAVFLMGCVSTANVVKEARYVDDKIASGEVASDLRSVDYTAQEEQVITHALNKVAAFRTKYGTYLATPGQLLAVNVNFLKRDYNELRDSFVAVERIVTDNYDQYDAFTQQNFLAYQIHAHNLDENVQNLMVDIRYREAIRAALNVGMMGIQLIAALK